MMSRVTRLLLIGCIFSITCSVNRAITLVQDGKPSATIVIAEKAFQAKPYQRDYRATPKPEEKIRTAAKDLQAYLTKISGSTLPIVSDMDVAAGKAGNRIYIGESTDTVQLDLHYPRGITKDFREEGYAIVSKNSTLVLVGNDTGPYHGTEYAVFDLLSRLGCRWYMPGEYGEYLPAMKTINVADCALAETPDFIERLWHSNGTAAQLAADDEFKIRNRMNYGPVLPDIGDESLRKWVPDKALIATQPELFGRNPDGTVSPYMVNLTNPDTVAIVAGKIKEDLKKQIARGVAIPAVALAPDDGRPIDLSEKTMAGNPGFIDLAGRQIDPTQVSISEGWFSFVNRVAEEVCKEYPDAIIGTNGYANRNMLPVGITLHPNLAVMFAAIWSDVLHPYNSPRSWQTRTKGEMLKRWCALNNRVLLYDYEEEMLMTCLTPVPQVHNLRVNIPLMKQWGMAGFWDESRMSWMEEGIATKYLRTRMMWDANLNVDAVLEDYYAHWYGAAAKPAKAFWNAIETCLDQSPLLGHEDRILPFVYSPTLLATLEKAVTAAEKLAADPRSREHVHIDRLILDHLKAYMSMHADEFAGKYTEAAGHAGEMWAIRQQVEQYSPMLCATRNTGPAARFLNSGEQYWGVQARKAFYLTLNDLVNGTTGTLVAMAPRMAKCALDPADIGHLTGWSDPGFDRKKWTAVDTCKPFYLQMPGALTADGVPYQGYLWYVFELNVPNSSKGKPVTLYAPIVVDDAWVWVNGRYIGHRGRIEPYNRPAPLQFDVTTAISTGQPNVIAVRVGTGYCATAVADGFMGRLFLYSPIVK